jgi:alpha-beta hydrolase superfamily lysophospholipase
MARGDGRRLAACGTLSVALTVALLVARGAVAEGLCAESTCLPDEDQPSGSIYRVCMPEPGCWNGDLVVFAHGYVAFNEEVAIPEDQLELPDGTSLPELINTLGFGFATTSYPLNGLAVREAVTDVRELVDFFTCRVGPPADVYLTGASEGGLVTALAVERFPEVFSGGLAACGPVGDFRWQVNWYGDFRVVFDLLFPGVLPGSAVEIPEEVIEGWDEIYEPRVREALAADPEATGELLRITKAPWDHADPSTREETILGLLWYSVFATNDAVEKLGGQPFGNRWRFYTGSNNDLVLNLRVRRYRADSAALAEIEANYQTSGALALPLVTLHTTGDPIVPFWHEWLYWSRTRASGSGELHRSLPVLRYGHCEFEPLEVLVSFALLVYQVRGQEVAGLDALLAQH